MPILFHQGTTFPRRAPLTWANPILLEDVALSFPKLRIIVAHLGHPWEAETVVLVRKQPNVWADISALHYRPWRYWQALITARSTPYSRSSYSRPTPRPPRSSRSSRGLHKANDVVAGTNLPRVPEEAIAAIVESNLRGFLREDEWLS